MRIADFQQHLRLTTTLGDSRVHETARTLRNIHLFPGGHKHVDRHVKINEAVNFLWAAFTNTTKSNLQISLMLSLALESESGGKFIGDLEVLLSNPNYLERLTSVELTNNFSKGLFAVIKFEDDSQVVYGRVPEFKSSTMISGDWLRSLAFNLYRKEYDPFAQRELNISLEDAHASADPKIFDLIREKI